MPVITVEMGTVLTQGDNIEYRFQVRGELSGVVVLNNIIPAGTTIRFDGEAFQYDMFPRQTIEFPKHHRVSNRIVIHVPLAVLTANTTIVRDLLFRLLLFHDGDPITLPPSTPFDVFMVRDTTQVIINHLQINNLAIYFLTQTLGDIETVNYRIGSVNTITGHTGEMILRNSVLTNQALIQISDFPTSQIFLDPQNSVECRYNFLMS